MAKTETIRARVEPELKKKADEVLAEIGVTATDAITRMYEEVVDRGELPFEDDETNSAASKRSSSKPKPKSAPASQDAPSSHTEADVASVSVERQSVQEQQPTPDKPDESQQQEVPKDRLFVTSSQEGAVSLGSSSPEAGIKPVNVLVGLGVLAFAALIAVLLYLLVAERSHTHAEYAEHTHKEYAMHAHAHDEYAEHTHTHEEYEEYAEHTHEEYAMHTHAHDEYAEHTHVVNPYGQHLLAGPSGCFPNCYDPYSSGQYAPYGSGFSQQPQYPAPSLYGPVPSPPQFWPSPEVRTQPNPAPSFWQCPDGQYYSFQAFPDCVYWGTHHHGLPR